MKVILLSDVKKVGKKGDIVDVSDGYARNFLLNKNLGVLATKKSMEILDEE
ncbi:MAG: 50S ribosomal protein L9, partial [Longicatena sp.]